MKRNSLAHELREQFHGYLDDLDNDEGGEQTPEIGDVLRFGTVAMFSLGATIVLTVIFLPTAFLMRQRRTRHM